jgi:protein disulfide-isomerase A1
MAKSLLLVSLVCVLFSFALCEEADDVVVLTSGSYSDFLKNNDVAFVEFYAPWCGHCKHLAPEWKKLATTLKGKLPVAKVDCTTEQSVCSEEGVEGYPTIKFFKKGQPIPYNGERSAEDMQEWAEKKLGDAYKTASSADQFAELTKGTAIVGFFANKESELFSQFADVASVTDDVPFVAVFDSSVSKDFTENTVKAYAPGQAAQTFENESALQLWVNEHGYPLVDRLGQKSYGRVTSSNKKFLVILFASNEAEVSTLETVAADFRKDLSFLWDLGEQYASHASRLGISGNKFPVLVGMDNKEKFYPGSETSEFTAETVKAFLNQLLSGEVSMHTQSEPVPESNDGPVKVIVGKTFQSEVVDSKVPVFLEVYAPWCGHCKQLAPVWDELGAEYKDKNVVIAKCDGTANDLPVRVQGFPTLLLFKPGQAEPITYEGNGRTLEAFKEFLSEHVSGAAKDEL